MMTDHMDQESRYRLAAIGLTHPGKVREENQDNFLIDEAAGVFAVMDGAGGLQEGSIASGLVKQSVARMGRPTNAEHLLQRFETCVIEAKGAIDELSRQQNGVQMGSTIAALLAFEGDFACVWAGDSRVYRLRDGVLEQITTDHTEVQDLLDRNLLTREEAQNWSRRHVITKAVGTGVDLDLELVSGKLRPGDRFLLCSDGLTEHVDNARLGAFLLTNPLSSAAGALIDAALEGGGRDNVTVVVVEIAARFVTEGTTE